MDENYTDYDYLIEEIEVDELGNEELVSSKGYSELSYSENQNDENGVAFDSGIEVNQQQNNDRIELDGGHGEESPDENENFISITTVPGLKNFMNTHYLGLLKFSIANNAPLDNFARDDLSRDIVRALLNSQHNMSMYYSNFKISKTFIFYSLVF